jgi:hypothetical protein
MYILLMLLHILYLSPLAFSVGQQRISTNGVCLETESASSRRARLISSLLRKAFEPMARPARQKTKFL